MRIYSYAPVSIDCDIAAAYLNPDNIVGRVSIVFIFANLCFYNEMHKKIRYSCGWMITFKLPSRGWAVSRNPSTVSFNGKTCVIISATLIFLY